MSHPPAPPMFEAGVAVVSQNLAAVEADDVRHRGAAIGGFVLPRSRVAASRRARAGPTVRRSDSGRPRSGVAACLRHQRSGRSSRFATSGDQTAPDPCVARYQCLTSTCLKRSVRAIWNGSSSTLTIVSFSGVTDIGITPLVERRQQRLHDPKRPAPRPWTRRCPGTLGQASTTSPGIGCSTEPTRSFDAYTRGASNSGRRTLYQWMRDLQVLRYVDPPLGIVLAQQLGGVSLQGLRIRRVQNDPFEARVLDSRQWTLPHPVAMLLLRPPAARRDGDAMPGTDLSESSAGETDAAGDTDDGLRPDLLIERFTGEDDWFVRHTPILAISWRT